MDCRTARLLLDYVRPQTTELQGSEAEALESHLTGCSECDGLARGERQADARIGVALRAVTVPEGLRSRLLGRLEAERNMYYRRLVGRGIAGVAAAAALFVAVLLGFGWRPGALPQFDAEMERENLRWFAARGNVEDLFRATYSVNVAAPAQFDYHYCYWAGMTEHKKKRVPMLFFVKQGHGTVDWARVLVVDPTKDFDVRDLQDDTSGSGGCNFQRLPGPNSHVEYLVFYTGDLSTFFENADHPNAGGA